MKHGEPFCAYGRHVIADDDYFYTVNPQGGYDRDEVLCCEKCIRLPQFAGVRERMVDLGARWLAE